MLGTGSGSGSEASDSSHPENSGDAYHREWPMFSVRNSSKKKSDEILISLNINNVPCKLELNTGAAVTVIPEEIWQKDLGSIPLQKSNVTLRSYSGHSIPVYGETAVHVKYGSQELDLPIIVTKGKGVALMGRDWLSKIKLNWHRINAVRQANQPRPKLEDVVQQYPKLFDGKLGTITGFTAQLKVNENATPQYFKSRPMPYALREKVEKELKRLVKEGVLKKVESSDWATPIVPVLKPDGTVRICGDFKLTINPYLDVPEYPMPTPDELFTKLNGGELFTKLDLSHAYQQVVLDEKSQPYVTINTHLGLYRYTRLPFGVAAAPAIFQQMIDKMLDGLTQTGGILDDLIVTGQNDEQHIENFHHTLKKFEERGAKFKVSKCAIMQPKVEYFAFVLDREGIHPSPAKVQAVLEVCEPENRTELQSFLGLVNYYRKFIPNMSTLVSPLNQLLSKDTPWCWNRECQVSFQALKDTLASSKVLVPYNPKLEVQLAVDASPVGLGAVISHITANGTERPIAYASRSLTKSERNYSVIEKEALAIIFGIRKFQRFLYGRRFTLLTDHQPLTLLFGSKKAIPAVAASRIQRWAIQLSAYQYDIKYRRSKQNENADALSRLSCKGTDVGLHIDEESADVNGIQVARVPISSKRLREDAARDPVLSRVIDFTLYGWPDKSEVSDNLKSYFAKRNEFTVEDGCLLRGTRVVIPAKHQETVLAELHLSHPGIVRMKALARLQVWWPALDSDIEQLVGDCGTCQITHSKAPLTSDNPWMWPHRPWQRVHVDYCGPFLGGFFLVVVDAKSKWLEVIPMSSTTAQATVDALRSLFAIHGLPEEIVSDNSPQFIAQEFKDFLRYNHGKQILSAPYHPASNGEAERAVRTFKQAMKAAKSEPGTISQKICSFLLSYRTTPHTATRCTPAELLMNRRLRTRLDLLRPDLRKKVSKPSKLQPTAPKRQLSVGDPVLVQDYRKSQDPWVKGVVVTKLGPVTYRVQVKELFWKRHIDQLKDLSGTKIQPHKQEQSEDWEVTVPQSLAAYSPTETPVTTVGHVPSHNEPTSNQSQPRATEAKPAPEQPRDLVNQEAAVSYKKSDRRDQTVFPERRYPVRDRRPPKRLIEQVP